MAYYVPIDLVHNAMADKTFYPVIGLYIFLCFLSSAFGREGTSSSAWLEGAM